MSDVAIKVENLSKDFLLPHNKSNSLKQKVISLVKKDTSVELQHALQDVSFEVKKGEFFGIVGRNGSGKSTLLKILAGIYTPTKGSVHVSGTLVPFIELGVGFNPELSGRDNVFLNGALLGFSRQEMEEMYDEIVEFAEIERFMDQKLKNYSSGMQVRLAFSIAIRAQGDILLLDEVLAVGDADFQRKCNDYFRHLKAENQTIILVTHSMDAVQEYCDRALLIDNGRVSSIGDPADVAAKYLLKAAGSTSSRKDQDNSLRSKKDIVAKISAQIVNQTNKGVELKIDFNSGNNQELYVGIAIIHNGRSFAEINTLNSLNIKGGGEIMYKLDTSLLNGGTYEIGFGLFSKDDQRLLAEGEYRCQFLIKSKQINKGGALKLRDTWKRVE